MNRAITFVFLGFFAGLGGMAMASDTTQKKALDLGPHDAVEINLQDFLWLRRPIVVFADTEADPRFQEQIELLKSRTAALEDRDVIILTDTNPQAGSEIREKLRPRGFMVVLIGKDGGVKLRKPFPWDVREFSRAIDKMPMRRQEIRDRRSVDE